MSEFPSLAEVLAKHYRRIDPNHPAYGACGGCGFDPDVTPGTKTFADHQADAWRETCTIRTVEELDALPADSTVMSLVATVAYQRARTPHSDWYSTGLSTIKSVDVPLPALLIWSPDWARP